jgi:predicted O-methyltransferase YrrM
MRYAHLLWVLCEAIGVKSVLEIGVGPTSVSGTVFCHSMGSRGGGRLVSYDIDHDRPAAIYRALAKDKGVDWRVVHGDSRQTFTYPGAEPFLFDLVYVDGDHDTEHAIHDTVTGEQYLRPGGYLVIDDYPGNQGVIDAHELLKTRGYACLHIPHDPPDRNGRLVWQKPRAL